MINVFQNFKISSILLLAFSLNVTAINCENHIHFMDGVTCDLCGCATSIGGSGFGTLDNVSFLGLKYVFQDYRSRDGIFTNSPVSKEKFNTYQLWSKIPIGKSFAIGAIVPYQDLNREFEDRTEHIHGIGDITLMGWYQLKFYKKRHKDHVDFNINREESGHRLNFGLGVKLPTGEFEEMLTDRVNPGFQVGTGSLDGVFSIMHSYSKKQFGINTSATYYIKTENKNDYRFGNQFSYASNVYYSMPFRASALSPFLGVSGDIYDSINQFGERLPQTSGNIVNGTVGTEFMIDKFILGANYTFPLAQSLFGDNVVAKNRLVFYLNYVL